MCTERRFVEYRHVLKTQEGYDDLFDDWSDLVINEEKWDLPKTTVCYNFHTFLAIACSLLTEWNSILYAS